MKIRDRESPFLTVHALVEARARELGERPALEVVGETATYADLGRLARRVASNLAARGIGKGDRVATFMHNNLAQVALWFAACRLGAVIAPMNVGLVGDDEGAEGEEAGGGGLGDGGGMGGVPDHPAHDREIGGIVRVVDGPAAVGVVDGAVTLVDHDEIEEVR